MPPAENSESQKPEYNLPPPVNETGQEGDPTQAENQPAGPETSGKLKTPKASNSKTQLVDFHLKDFTAQSPTTDVPTTTSTDSPAVADDNDLIEKEWVAKAKKIIEENREDPKNQSKEITLFKADYMKKRYNKAIKVSE